MIASVSVGPYIERWFGRHEPLQRFVWVDRCAVEDNPAASEALLRAAEREAHANHEHEGLEIVAAGRWESPFSEWSPAGVATTFVPHLSLVEAIALRDRVWPDPADAVRAVCAVAPSLLSRAQTHLRPIDPTTLAVDAWGRVFIAKPFPCAAYARAARSDASAAPSNNPCDEPREQALAIARLAAQLTEGRALPSAVADALECALDPDARFASPDALLRALHQALGGAIECAPNNDNNDQFTPPASLDDGPLALARAAQHALDDASARTGPWAQSISERLMDMFENTKRSLRPEHLALLATLELTRTAMHEASLRSTAIERWVLALLGPLEPTWIPLSPEGSTRTLVARGETHVVCPVVWTELQPTSVEGGEETRFCLACAKPVHCVMDEDGAPHVIASDRCVFARERRRRRNTPAP